MKTSYRFEVYNTRFGSSIESFADINAHDSDSAILTANALVHVHSLHHKKVLLRDMRSREVVWMIPNH